DISYTSSVMNAVINSVMFMEISINEFFEDVSITNLDDFKAPSLLDIDKIGKDAVKRIKYFLEIDKNFLKRESILDKYNLALLLCEKSTLKKNEEPYQSANLLVGFRNDLVYHKLKANETNLERSLSNKFNLHAKSEKEPYYYPYPKNHLSHECAKWAVSSSRKFVEEFFEKVGITPVYLKEIAQLSRLLEFK
ncbi:MAG: hypothetical protein SAL07_20480, partial [Oscillatoria sp. PMC 1051.18]|nr:hypothetical protein [Oscillatoria sp. PMC 1051.18]